MSGDGRAIANFILDRCDEQGRRISHLALQKLVFFCHVWSLVQKGQPLVRHQFEAWEYGPVLPYLYRDFREFERDPITTRARSLNPNTGTRDVVEGKFDDETKKMLTKVVNFYSRLSATDLVKISHVKGGPWDQIWNHSGKVNPGMRIPNELIAEFYVSAKPPFTLQ